MAVETIESPGNLLILADRFLAELVEPEGTKPAAEGEVAELVLTRGRVGSPLIRYRTGDLVKGRRTVAGMVLQGGILRARTT